MFFVFRFWKPKKIQINWVTCGESFQCDSFNIFRPLWFIVVWPFDVKKEGRKSFTQLSIILNVINNLYFINVNHNILLFHPQEENKSLSMFQKISIVKRYHYWIPKPSFSIRDYKKLSRDLPKSVVKKSKEELRARQMIFVRSLCFNDRVLRGCLGLNFIRRENKINETFNIESTSS